MRKVVYLSIALLLMLSALPTFAQRRVASLHPVPDFDEPTGWSIGTNIGLSDLWSDVGTQSLVDHYSNKKYWHNTKYMGGLFVRYTVMPAIAVRLGFNTGTIYADDNWNYDKATKASSIEDDAYQRTLRNLNVKSKIWEAQLLAEINIFRLNMDNSRARRRFQPFIMLGVGYFYYQPKGEYRPKTGGPTQWVDLRSLHLEGQAFDGYNDAPAEYSLTQLEVPLGLGLRWDIGQNLGLALEYQYRYCMTDYLDDVSGKYIDPALFATHLPADKAVIAMDMYDKSWQIDINSTMAPGELRGNPSVPDAFSTISVSLFYRMFDKQKIWWR